MKLTQEQQRIYDSVMHEVGSSPVPVTTAITGYAGTGKTTLVSHIANNFNPNRILFLAMTGKAVSVLKNKLPPNVDCKTIHSAFFCLNEGNKTCPYVTCEEWSQCPRGKQSNKLQFYENWSALMYMHEWYDLIVVDEASMLNEFIFKTVNKAKVHKIFVGDPGQLPPVDGTQIEILSKTPNRLQTVMRQALDNPIIALATQIRSGEYLRPMYKAPHLAVGHNADPKSVLARIYYDLMRGKALDMNKIILCYTNRTRIAINMRVRKNLGYKPNTLLKGEKIVCIKNNWDVGLINGQLYTVDTIQKLYHEDDNRVFVYLMDIIEDSTHKTKLRVIADPRTFGAKDAQKFFMDKGSRQWVVHMQNKHQTCPDQGDCLTYFDYGYALSVHKAQGSEWPIVYLANERGCDMSYPEIRQWMYTGVTRAKNKLYVGLDY